MSRTADFSYIYIYIYIYIYLPGFRHDILILFLFLNGLGMRLDKSKN